MARFFFSGINEPSLVALLAKQQACGMLNATSAAEPAVQEAIALHESVSFALDSGSVQGNQNIGGYARLITSMADRLVLRGI